MSGLSPAILKTMPLFADVPERDLPGIARSLSRREVAPGESMTHEGKGGDRLLRRRIRLRRRLIDGRTVKTLGPGDYFGEIALLAGSMRTATVTSAAGMVCWGMRAWNFTPMVSRQPTIAEKLLDAMARQLAG